MTLYVTYDNGVLTEVSTELRVTAADLDAAHARLVEHLTRTGEGAAGIAHRIEVHAVHGDGSHQLLAAAGYGLGWASLYGGPLFDLDDPLGASEPHVSD